MLRGRFSRGMRRNYKIGVSSVGAGFGRRLHGRVTVHMEAVCKDGGYRVFRATKFGGS
jgi:hypothetical protein